MHAPCHGQDRDVRVDVDAGRGAVYVLGIEIQSRAPVHVCGCVVFVAA